MIDLALPMLIAGVVCISVGHARVAAEPPTAENRFEVNLPEHRFAGELLTDSPFGINMALRPDAADMQRRLKAMQRAGIKWGRQDFTWRRIEREPGVYDWAPYDRLVDAARRHGILLFGNLAYAPKFHDPRTPQGAEAYAAFARAAVVESPIYILGPPGLKATVRPNPGW